MVDKIKSKDIPIDIDILFKYSRNRFNTFLKYIDYKPVETISNEYFLLSKFRTTKTFVIKPRNQSSIDYVFMGTIHFIDKTEDESLLDVRECICSHLDIKNNETLLFYPYDKNKRKQEYTFLVFKCINTKNNKVKF